MGLLVCVRVCFVFVCTSTCLYIRVSVCLCVRLGDGMLVRVFVFICLHVCMHVCTYVCMYVVMHAFASVRVDCFW